MWRYRFPPHSRRGAAPGKLIVSTVCTLARFPCVDRVMLYQNANVELT